MTTTTIEPGLKGTLSPDEYTTRTMPHWGQVYLSAMAKYGDMDYVSISYVTDADKAAALIPEQLELVKIPALPGQAVANLVFAKYRECDLGPYMEVIVSIPVLHNSEIYGYLPAIYVDTDSAMLEIYAGDAASLDLHPTKEDPLGRLLPCNSVLGAFIIRGDMYTKADEWELVEDLKKTHAG